jgi:hypothetical protein
MSRTRWTWVVVGGVATLLFVAGVDALRSSADDEASAPTASTTRTEIPSGSLDNCTQRDLRVSIEIRKGVASVVARNTGAHDCYRLLHISRLTIEDRAGNLVAELRDGGGSVSLTGFFPAGSERAFWLPQQAVLCDSPGPYLALAIVGPYSARRGDLSASEIACGGTFGTRVSPLRAKYIARADAICRAATDRFSLAAPLGTELEELAAWSKAAARASEGAIAELRALAPPKGDRVAVERVLSFMERLPGVLRRLAAAASAGETARFRILAGEQIRLTHRKDALLQRVALLWRASPDALQGCPVRMPA